MQRQKNRVSRRTAVAVAKAPLASAILLAIGPAAYGQSALEEIIVTAQKRGEENIQNIPLSIQAFSTAKLEELNIQKFDDYVKHLPSVSYQTFGPGYALVYMRGVASGGDGNHSGPLPSVGIYLDEQPITTIQGALDVHLYDIARVEALAGPQGTLYGASSQAGTIRIITNKPDPSGFSAAWGIEGNTVSKGGTGYLAEGYVNLPLGENSAIRLVGWARRDAGFIDNVAATRTWPACASYLEDEAPCTLDSTPLAKKDFNEVDTIGARAALRVDLGESWTITPTLMAQEMKADGVYGYDPSVGELQVRKFYPDTSKDGWVQAALTVEGRIANLDVTYAGSFLNRDGDTQSDYSDYSYFYDQCCYYSLYITDDDGNPTIGQYIKGRDRYERFTHELRVATPTDRRLRFIGGLFLQRQGHDIQQRYMVDNLADALSVTGWPDTIWLTKQLRVDRDRAAFGELSYDLTDKLTLTGGVRFFEAENSLEGFFGYADWGWSSSGEAQCSALGLTEPFNGAPCKYMDKTTKESDSTHKLNLTYRIDDDRMVYLTWSEGFRPGGINRRGTLPPYAADFLTNYEFGWKTTWAGGRLRFNGAVFHQEWEDFQFALLGLNGLTEIKNSAQAQIRGFEADVTWAIGAGLTISGGIAQVFSKLTENYCGFVDEDGKPETDCPEPEAPEGTRLPVTPKLKANLTLRHEFPLGSFDGWWHASVVHQGDSRADLRDEANTTLGDQPGYEIVDFSAGLKRNSYSIELSVNNVFDERAMLYRFVQCAESICGAQPYVVTTPPRTIGLKFSQKF